MLTDISSPIRLEANHVIDKSQVWISTIPVGYVGTIIMKKIPYFDVLAYRPQNVEFHGTWGRSSMLPYQDAVGEGMWDLTSSRSGYLSSHLALCRISENIPYGILFFVPSYQMLDKLFRRWKVYFTECAFRNRCANFVFFDRKQEFKAD